MREKNGRARAQKERGERIGAHVVVKRPCVGRPAPLKGFKRRFAGRKLRVLEASRKNADAAELVERDVGKERIFGVRIGVARSG